MAMMATGQPANREGHSIGREELLKRVVKRILAGDLAGADKILDSMAHTIKSTSGKAFYHSLIHTCAKAGSPKAAEWCADRLVRSGIKPNTVTYNSVIDACARVGNVALASRWLEMMKNQSLKPNGITYNTMIKACAQARDASGAEWWMGKMQEEGFLPCIVTFSTIIDALAKTGKVEKAETWFRYMEEFGVEPDAVLYNCIINACARAGNPSKAEHWLTQMRTHGLQADERTYNSVINACAKVGAVSRAEKWFRKMEQDGCKADKVTFGSLINACARVGNIEKAEFWIHEMQRRGTEPNLICLNTVLHACAQRGDHEKALKWFRCLAEAGEPNKVSYNSMLDAFAKSGMYDDMESWLQKMLIRGIPIDEITYATMLRARSRNQEDSNVDAAVLWTITTIVKVHARVGDIQPIPLWLGELADNGLQPPPGLFEECLTSVAALSNPPLLARLNSLAPLFTSPPAGTRLGGKPQVGSPHTMVRRALAGRFGPRGSGGGGGGNAANPAFAPSADFPPRTGTAAPMTTPNAVPPGLVCGPPPPPVPPGAVGRIPFHSGVASLEDYSNGDMPSAHSVPSSTSMAEEAFATKAMQQLAAPYAQLPPQEGLVPMPFSSVAPLLPEEPKPQPPSNVDTFAYASLMAARTGYVHFERMSF